MLESGHIVRRWGHFGKLGHLVSEKIIGKQGYLGKFRHFSK